MLKKYLEAQGKRVYYFHAVKFSLANKLSEANRKKTVEKSVTKANWLTISLRKFFLKIDLIRFKKFYKKLESQDYDYILSDRHFYDSLVNISFLGGSTSIWKLNFQIPKPDIAVYLKTDPEIIMRRERIPDQGLEYLNAKNELYSNAPENWSLVTIDGNRDKNIIFEEIRNLCQNSIS